MHADVRMPPYNRRMSKLAIAIGNLLILVGLIGYFVLAGESGPHWTALIPALIGLPIEVAGLLALAKPQMRKHAMHVALVFALLGVLGTVTSLFKLPALLSDASSLDRPGAVGAQAITFLLCAVLLVAGIVSFIRARRA